MGPCRSPAPDLSVNSKGQQSAENIEVVERHVFFTHSLSTTTQSVHMKMASQVNGVPNSERCVPGSVNIPLAPWPASLKTESVDAKAVASQIINSFNQSLEKGDYNAVADLFTENGYWRDHLAATWDLRTAKGKQKIAAFLKGGHHLVSIDNDEANPLGVPKVAPLRSDGSSKGIPFTAVVTTKHGSGRAYVRLIEDAGKWKIWTLFTNMNALKVHPEPLGRNRPSGVQHGAQVGRMNWLDRRLEESNFANGDPAVLIVGKSEPISHPRCSYAKV